MLSHSELLELRRWNTPTVYNGWEMATKKDRLECVLSHDSVTDYMPEMGPMVGYAVTVEYTCSNRRTREENKDAYLDLFEYLAGIDGPKILCAKDLDAPDCIGSIFGEVTGNAYRALGCAGAITDGYVRDVDEAAYAGFKMLARRLGVGHAYSCPVRFGSEIEIYGAKIKPGMLIHADKYGFIAIEEEDTPHLLEAVRFMDSNECAHTIRATRETQGLSKREILDAFRSAWHAFDKDAAEFKKSIL